MKKLIILEDEPYRLMWLKKAMPDVDYISADNVHDFIQAYDLEALSGTEMTVVLDHDLGKDRGNGLQAVRLMKERTVRPQIVIWSLNPVGSRNMVLELNTAGFDVVYAPFGTDGTFDTIKERLA